MTVTREPLGVVGLICPWNFPIAIPAWKMAPALAFGNTVVFKPADLVPGSAWALVEILSRAGLPKGVLNLVMGRGSVVGQTMLDSRGRQCHLLYRLGRDAAPRSPWPAPRAAPSSSSKWAARIRSIVLDDANLDAAVAAAIDGAFYQTGQRCTASSRLIVAEQDP